jgi:hypothetical protein
MPSKTYISIDYVTDDTFLLIQLNDDSTVQYIYSKTVDEQNNKVTVRGKIFPELYFVAGNETLNQLSADSAEYTSDRRTLTVRLPDGTDTIDLSIVPIYGRQAEDAIANAFICFRAMLKDAGLPIDLTDFGFTNTQTIGTMERSLDLYA